MAATEPGARLTAQGETAHALLRMGRTKLLVPRGDVRVLELAIDMERKDPPAHGVGWIGFNRRQWPVYCPSEALEWLGVVPEDRAVCAVIGGGDRIFGLLCGEATLLKSDELVLHGIPAAMAAPGMPFHQLAVHDGSVACVSSAEELFAHLMSGAACEALAGEGMR